MLANAQPEPDTKDDFLLAQMLQLEFDKEHDTMLTAEEKHFNKHSKGIYVVLHTSVLKCCIIICEQFYHHHVLCYVCSSCFI